MNKRLRLLLIFVLFLLPAAPPAARADDIGLIFRGVAKTLFSVLQIPGDMIKGSTHVFPLGLIVGAATGTMKAVMGTLSGAADIARGAAPYAKYAALAFV